LKAELPDELTMLIVVLAGGGVAVPGLVGVTGPPPPLPPQLTAHSTAAESAIEMRSILFMLEAKAKAMPREMPVDGARNSGRDCAALRVS
jgi:hypothetical protein